MNNKIWLFLTLLIFTCINGDAQNSIEIHKGLQLYSSLDIDFQIDTNNDIVFLGEQHGDKESKVILMQLINYMYKEHGLRDIAIEEDSAFNEHANNYIYVKIDDLRTELILRKDVLDVIREFNRKGNDTPLNVHLIDIDSPKSTIDEHLIKIANKNILNELNIPDLGEEYISIDKTGELIERIEAELIDDKMYKELQSLKDSLYLYQHMFLITEEKVRVPNKVSQAPIRETVITRNIAAVKEKIGEKPLLVFIGGAHAMKSNQILSTNYLKPSAQQLNDLGYSVFSIFWCRLSGEYYWRGRKEQVNLDLDNIVFQDGETLKSVLYDYENYKLVRLDLKQPLNLGVDILDFRFKTGVIDLVYDEIIFINDATPMEY